MIELEAISKRYGRIYANSNVTCRIREGRVTALLGDNGAGKTTLFKIICGVIVPSEGRIRVRGAEVAMSSARDALAFGVSAVYQDLALAEERDIAHNISLGRIPTRLLGFWVDRRRMNAIASETLTRIRASLPPVTTPVRSLSGGQRQAVAIARAVAQGGDMILMDEPTAALGIREQRMVLDLINDLKAQGHTILIISHNLDHVFEVADDLIVLRGGRLVTEVERTQVNHDELARLILNGKPRDPLPEEIVGQEEQVA